MAYTVTTKNKNVFGNLRVHILDVTADAATQAVATGLDNIIGFSVGIKSITTSFYSMHENVNASGTATLGTIGMSGLVSGDEFFLTVFGT